MVFEDEEYLRDIENLDVLTPDEIEFKKVLQIIEEIRVEEIQRLRSMYVKRDYSGYKCGEAERFLSNILSPLANPNKDYRFRGPREDPRVIRKQYPQREAMSQDMEYMLSTVTGDIELKNIINPSKLCYCRLQTILDSGATRSIFQNKNIFTNYQPLTGRYVTMADGSKTPIAGYGCVVSPFHPGFRLPGCLHVPTVTKNLLSTSHVTQVLNNSIYIDNETALIHLPAGETEIWMEAPQTYGLYIFDPKYFNDPPTSTPLSYSSYG